MSAPPDLDIDAFGAVVSVEFDALVPDSWVSAARAAWARCRAHPGERRTRHRLCLQASLSPDTSTPSANRVTAARPAQLQEQIVSAVTRTAIEQRAGGPLLLHAAALEVSPGRVHGFIAPSGTGKTTLARTLGRQCGYVTDETLVVDPDDLTVTAYPKPLCILPGHRAEPGEHGEAGPGPEVPVGCGVKAIVGPDALGLRPLSGQRLRLAGLHFVERAPGASVVSWPIDAVEAIMRSAQQASMLSSYERPLASLHALVRQCAEVDVIRYGEAGDLSTRFAAHC